MTTKRRQLRDRIQMVLDQCGAEYDRKKRPPLNEALADAAIAILANSKKKAKKATRQKFHKKKKQHTRQYTATELREMPYKDYLHTQHWIRTRRKALKQNGYQCYNCGARSHLQVHHLTYIRRGNERQEDLRVLCWKCHEKVHQEQE